MLKLWNQWNHHYRVVDQNAKDLSCSISFCNKHCQRNLELWCLKKLCCYPHHSLDMVKTLVMILRNLDLCCFRCKSCFGRGHIVLFLLCEHLYNNKFNLLKIYIGSRCLNFEQ